MTKHDAYFQAQQNGKLYQMASDKENHSVRFRNAAYKELKKRDSKSANMARYGQLKKPAKRKQSGNNFGMPRIQMPKFRF